MIQFKLLSLPNGDQEAVLYVNGKEVLCLVDAGRGCVTTKAIIKALAVPSMRTHVLEDKSGACTEVFAVHGAVLEGEILCLF
jgi:hypothetical protein